MSSTDAEDPLVPFAIGPTHWRFPSRGPHPWMWLWLVWGIALFTLCVICLAIGSHDAAAFAGYVGGFTLAAWACIRYAYSARGYLEVEVRADQVRVTHAVGRWKRARVFSLSDVHAAGAVVSSGDPEIWGDLQSAKWYAVVHLKGVLGREGKVIRIGEWLCLDLDALFALCAVFRTGSTSGRADAARSDG